MSVPALFAGPRYPPSNNHGSCYEGFRCILPTSIAVAADVQVCPSSDPNGGSNDHLQRVLVETRLGWSRSWAILMVEL